MKWKPVRQWKYQQNTSQSRNMPTGRFRLALPQPVPQRPLEKHVGLYVTYEDVTGQKASINKLNSLLSRLNLDQVLRVISTINNLYSAEATFSKKTTRARQVGLAQTLLSEDMMKRLTASSFGRDPNTILFHRQQQLYLLRHALMSCSHDSGMVWNQESAQMFGEACLVANNLLDSSGARLTPASEDDNLLDLVRMVLPLMEFGSDHDFTHITGRAVQLWLSIPDEPQLRGAADYIDMPAVFQEAYGVDLDTFLKVLTVVYFHVLNAKVTVENAWTQFIIHVNSSFENTTYSTETLKKVMSALSYRLADMGDMLYNQPTQSPGSDFTTLYRYPAIEVADDVFVMYDKMVLLRFFTHGIWWLIHNALPEDRRGDFRSFFGSVFAIYVERMLQHICASENTATQGQLFIRPKFGSNDEAGDALITEGDTWIMIETKASLLTTQAKYSGESRYLKTDIDSKFVGSSSKKKGVAQLANSIKKLVKGSAIMHTDLNVAHARTIYPVLVSYDGALQGKITSNYLDSNFRRLLGELQEGALHIMPLTVVTMEDMEVILSLGHLHSISSLLASYRDSALPLENFKNYLLRAFKRDIRAAESFSRQNSDALTQRILSDFTNPASDTLGTEEAEPETTPLA